MVRASKAHRLLQEYREHEASREHIELAYEQIVNQSFRARRKQGFRPSRGKRGERTRYEVPPGILGKIKGLVDPSVTLASAARDLFMFCAIALWSAATIGRNNASLVIAFGYAVFRTMTKRKIRNPDGPYFGDSPVFGALVLNVACMVVAMVAANQISAVVPFWMWNINPDRASAFLFIVFLCPLNMFLK
jgi:Protein CHAPERONE-LIKE PROTEIN OF POR1-like